MTLLELTRLIGSIAAAQPQIGEVIPRNVYDLDTRADATYAVFAWQQTQHSASAYDDVVGYGFQFFYIDRLTETMDNATEIQSVGVQVLGNIIRTLAAQGVSIDGYTIQPFSQKFSDECAGVYATLTINAVIDYTCEQLYD